MSAVVLDLAVASMVEMLLKEASRQFGEFTGLIERAYAAIETMGRDEVRRMIDLAGDRLAQVKLLVDEVHDWSLDDNTGIVALHSQAIVSALAVADAEFQQAAAIFGTR